MHLGCCRLLRQGQFDDAVRPVAVQHAQHAPEQLVAGARRQHLALQRHVARPDAQPHVRAHRRVELRHRDALARHIDAGQLPVAELLGDHPGEHAASFETSDHRLQFDVAQHVQRRACGDAAALVHHHHLVGQAQHLVHLVRHVDDRQAVALRQRGQVAEQLVAARRVERGQRLVHQQRARARQQRPPDGHALPFAARQGVRPARQQVADAEQVDHVGQGRAVGTARQPVAEQQVAAHAQVRKEPAFLKHDAERALVRRHIGTVAAVEQAAPCHLEAAARRAQQARHRVQQGRLARTAAADDGGDAARRQRDLRLHREIGAGDAQVEVDHAICPSQRCTRRWHHCATPSAPSASSTDHSTRRAAASSPPGC